MGGCLIIAHKVKQIFCVGIVLKIGDYVEGREFNLFGGLSYIWASMLRGCVDSYNCMRTFACKLYFLILNMLVIVLSDG
jgi:hypothetical protein